MKLMSKALILKYPGAYYHVMNRGNRWEDIFINNSERGTVVDGLADRCKTYDVRPIGYVLMANHLLVRTPRANLSKFMRPLTRINAPSARAERV